MTQNTSGSKNFNPASGTSTDPMHQTADQAKEAVSQVAGQAKEAASNVAGQAKDQMATRLSSEKTRAVHSLGSVAEALRQTGQQLREQNAEIPTQYIDRVASEVERVSGYLERRDMGQLVQDVEQFARRQPTLFLGGAFVLGLIGARFLKSSAPTTGYAPGNQYALAERGNLTQTPSYSQQYLRTSGATATTDGQATWTRPTSERENI
jgi:uncharacterized protein YjbJ (UPF0337 family)